MRLILLTGCRSGEVRRLRWRDVTRDVTRDRLVLRESKTGSRQVQLGEDARNLLDGLSKPRSGEWVFPGRAPEGHLSEGALYWFWCWVRDEAGSVGNARRHDLRHRFASHAVLQGVPLPVVSRLLGPQATKHDAALCPRGRPRDRGSRRTHWRNHRERTGYFWVSSGDIDALCLTRRGACHHPSLDAPKNSPESRLTILDRTYSIS